MNSLEAKFEEAQVKHRRGDLKGASTLYQEILNENPAHVESLHALAFLLTQINQLPEALDLIDTAIQLKPELAELYNSKGNILLRLQEAAEAEKQFKIALHYAPQHALAHNNLGNAYYHQKLYELAEVEYLTALKLQPKLIDARYNLALIYLSQNKAKEAIDLLKEILPLNPEHFKAATQLAKIYYNEASFSESIIYFNQALKFQSKSPEFLHDFGLALLANKNYSEAIKQFEDCLSLDNEHPEAHYHLATAYLKSEDLKKALNHYMQQLSVKPSLDSYYNIGVILTTQNRNEEAIPYFEEVLKVDPNYINAHLNLGVIHLKAGRNTQAIQYYEQALKIKPTDTEIKYILAGLSQSKDTPSSAPAQYLSNLFDQYALYYDKHLKEQLQYQVPEEILKALKNNTELEKARWKILDLGCGTGLSGALLKPYASKLIGVDISENMLDLASQKNIYTQLEKADIQEYLKNAKAFDCIVAADVFSYHGDLDNLFKTSFESLKNKGYFVFSVERGFEYPYHLQASLRYTHTKQYLEELIKKYHFNCLSLDNLILRHQQNEAVEGYLVLLQKKES